MNQVTFKFPANHDYSAENFLQSASNIEAYNSVNNFPWSGGYALNIFGEKASGKTHLAKIAADEIEVVEDVNSSFNEQDLLHKLNSAKENNSYILLTSNSPLADINFQLPDLTSRLKAIPSVEINQPDEQLTYMLLARQFAAKQLVASDEVLNFLTMRINRDFQSIFIAVEKIDNLSLQQKRNITIPLIKEVL